MDFPELFHTDLYQLTMGQAYFNCGKRETRGSFELFFRRMPFNGGYAVFCGRNSICAFLENIEKSLSGFLKYFNGSKEKCVNYFQNKYSFSQEYSNYLITGLIADIKELEIHTVEEGEIVFENTPLVQVSGKLIAMQIIETPLLQMVNSQSIVATKAARVKHSAGNRSVADFGLRRAHNPGLTYSAMLGGCDSTSNVLSGLENNFSVTGTMAHSYIMSFTAGEKGEIDAFREYVKTFPENYVFLVDTYDVEKGILNAIKAAKEAGGKGFSGIRLDSGDLCYWAFKARKMLDDAGFLNAKVFASNDIDEYIIEALDSQAFRDYGISSVPIDGFGVGTKLITAFDQPALGAVYKLVEVERNENTYYVIKVSANPVKTTIPAKKKLYRYFNSNGDFELDFMALPEEKFDDLVLRVFHKDFADKYTDINLNEGSVEALLKPLSRTSISDINVQRKLSMLPKWHRRLSNPHIYKVSLTQKLFNIRKTLIKNVLSI